MRSALFYEVLPDEDLAGPEDLFSPEHEFGVAARPPTARLTLVHPGLRRWDLAS